MRTAQDLDVLSGGATDSAPRRPLGIALAAGAVVLLLDQLTKWWAVSALADAPCGPDGEGCIHLIGSLRLHLVYNTGAAFSTADGLGVGPVFGVIALVMSLFLLNMARSRTDVVGPVVLGVIAGGALGNLVDRAARADGGFLTGAVVDFIDLQWWPVWNVADSAVVVGVILFALLAMRDDASAEEGEPADAAGEGEHAGQAEDAGQAGEGDAAPDADRADLHVADVEADGHGG